MQNETDEWQYAPHHLKEKKKKRKKTKSEQQGSNLKLCIESVRLLNGNR